MTFKKSDQVFLDHGVVEIKADRIRNNVTYHLYRPTGFIILFLSRMTTCIWIYKFKV